MNEVIVVDYKATAKSGEVSIDAEWQESYKRQMEVYQWLARKQDLEVSDTGYFIYCNGQDAEAFDGKIEFTIKLLPYVGTDSWIEPTLKELKSSLMADELPESKPDCEFCGYFSARTINEVAKTALRQRVSFFSWWRRPALWTHLKEILRDNR